MRRERGKTPGGVGQAMGQLVRLGGVSTALPGLRSREATCGGRAIQEIEQQAAAQRIHRVVMGYVGRSGWRNAIWGSTTERTVRHTAQAVLVIKGDRSAQA